MHYAVYSAKCTQKHIMHSNKLFSYTSQLKVYIFRKQYHFHNAQNCFSSSVGRSRCRPLFTTDDEVYPPHDCHNTYLDKPSGEF